MYTSFLTLVLTVQASTLGAEIAWSQDYAQARQQSAAESKPMAVILGNGQLPEDGLTKEVSDLLSTYYVCVYVDTTSPKGKELATAFGMTTGIVLSDRTGAFETYRQQGALTNDLMPRLKIYSTGTIRTTNYRAASTTNTGAASTGSVVDPAPANYCPTCNGGGGRYRR